MIGWSLLEPNVTTPKIKKLLFVFSKPPHSTLASKEGIDAVLTASAFGQDVSLLLLGDGVFQALKDQDPTKLPAKNTAATFAALEMYGVENIYAHSAALRERNLTEDSFCVQLTALNNTQIGELFNTQHQILSF